MQMTKYFDVWVICEKHEFQKDIKAYMAENGEIPGIRFCFIPMLRIEKRLQKIPGLYYLGYNLWHRRAFKMAKALNREVHFDIAHQVNISGFREPGYLWKLNLPWIWGPIGGTQNYPWRFLPSTGFKGTLIEGFRTILNILQLRFSPRVLKATKRASVLLAANSTCQNDFRRIHKVNPIIMLETGVSDVVKGVSKRRVQNGPLRILWSGFFQRRKALHLLFKALSKLPDSVHYNLVILGRGPLENEWRQMCKRLGIDKFCTWKGWLARDKAFELYAWADIFVFTSLRDTTGNVVLEALSRGVPIVCLDHQGVGDIVNDKCGVKIPLTTYEEVVLKLRDSILHLANNRAALENMSQGAIKRAKDYLWTINGRRMAILYMEVLKTKAWKSIESSSN